MLSQKYRFHSRGGVNFVYQKGTTLRAPHLSLVYMPNNRGFRRFAIIVSKKVLKSAVGRNRIRRRVYEAIRLADPSSLPPIDCIFIIHNRNYATMSFSELCTTVHGLINHAVQNTLQSSYHTQPNHQKHYSKHSSKGEKSSHQN